jgi:hypothetical protein
MEVYGHTLNANQISCTAIWILNAKGDYDENINAIAVGWGASCFSLVSSYY